VGIFKSKIYKLYAAHQTNFVTALKIPITPSKMIQIDKEEGEFAISWVLPSSNNVFLEKLSYNIADV